MEQHHEVVGATGAALGEKHSAVVVQRGYVST
jgi:hypothetical protein